MRFKKIFLLVLWLVVGVCLFQGGAKNLSALCGTSSGISHIAVVFFGLALFLGEMQWRLFLKKSVERDPKVQDFVWILLIGGSGLVLLYGQLPFFLSHFLRMTMGFMLLRGSSARFRTFLTQPS